MIWIKRSILAIAIAASLLGQTLGAIGAQNREELGKLSTQQLLDLVTNLEAALRAQDFRTAFSLATSLSVATSAKASTSVAKNVAIDEQIRQLELSLDGVGPAGNPLVRRAVAVLALKSGDFAKAKAQADTAIAELGRVRYPVESAIVPETLHICYTVLGIVALNAGDLGSARQALLNAGSVADRPGIFPGPSGPEFSLAKALLERGDTGVVTSYLEHARLWWPSGAAQLDQWIAAIRGNGKPLFPQSARGF